MFYRLESEELLVTLSDLGATIVRFIDKKTGRDIVLGYDSEEEYIAHGGFCMGASIGRNANRIGGASFSLNGKRYELTANDHGNQLHGGGMNGFAFKRWRLCDTAKDHLTFTYFSKDGEEGFPGNLRAYVTYTIEGNELLITFEGESDEDTLFNMTNHAYFNLGDPDILKEELMIPTEFYSPTDGNSLTLEETRPVDATPYDFREYTPIGERVKDLPQGIDNNYVFEYLDWKLLASLRNDTLQLDISSDLPDIHLYTAYHLDGFKGKYDEVYGSYKGVALEAQYYPNAINYEGYIKPVLPKGEKRKNCILLKLTHR